jgi:hypothetical protein
MMRVVVSQEGLPRTVAATQPRWAAQDGEQKNT